MEEIAGTFIAYQEEEKSNTRIMGKSSKSKAATKKAPVQNKDDKKINNTTKTDGQMTKQPVSKEVVAEHLPPLALVFTVIACSGFLFVFSFRDVFATGRNVAGEMDEAMLVCNN